ncbi:UDP-N-acetylmuramoyl-L-alanyl-D-glutamate--2,6-diaminopimelate ligase [Georgenia sp. Z1491]|uniref:UDP-N-acetylmuramoyl-L-alanyl-D-glutamate--2, 6-diaminopimelate ligase n=1 Tax=Georgenia sp. Z1491 TaxID=3416707 RepID=UPI003CF3B550
MAPVDLAELTRAAEQHLVGPAPGAGTRVAGVVADNRRIIGGELFVARPGARHHAARFAPDAVARGAAAILTDPEGARLARAGGDPGVPLVVVDDVAAVVGPVAALAWGRPAERLRTFALTGTNGKTTTAFMVDHVLTALGRTTGLIGTVEIRVAGTSVPAALTTPQADELHAMLAAMAEAGVTDLVMEVSSHALMLGRVDGVTFDVAGFTHLTPDHLDLHRTVEEYFAAKARLFAPDRSRTGVITVDDSWGARLAADAGRARPGQVWTLGRSADARLRIEAAPPGTLVLTGPGGDVRTATDMPGAFNVANAALAVGMVLRAGHGTEEVSRALADHGGVSPAVPGRMEVLAESPRVVVDFAHNTEALQTVLAELRPTTKGRLWCVTGSAGDRDAVKRPLMGEVSARLADEVVITDDDPHSEDPATIRAQILAGARSVAGTSVVEIGDRREAIAHAVLAAAPEDTVLLAGRGHETIQEVGDVAHHLDDREEARAALARRGAGTGEDGA